jgi:hypothetical protein
LFYTLFAVRGQQFSIAPSTKKGRDTVIPAFLNWLLLVPLVSGGELPAFGCESTPRKMHAHPRSQSQLNITRCRQLDPGWNPSLHHSSM